MNEASNSIKIDIIGSKQLYEQLCQSSELQIDQYMKKQRIFSDIFSFVYKNISMAKYKDILLKINGSHSLFQNKKTSTFYKFLLETKSKYLVIDLLDFNFIGNKNLINHVYENSENFQPHKLQLFRQLCDSYFRDVANQYTKIFLLVERPDPAIKNSKSLWFSEELNASARNMSKVKNVMIPLRDALGQPVLEENKHIEGANAILQAILQHNDLVPNYETNAELSGDSISGQIVLSPELDPKNANFSFYLLRYGTIVQKSPGYTCENNFTFALVKVGIYQIAGFVKRLDNGRSMQKMSLPVAYFPQTAVSEYDSWKLNYTPQSKLLYQPLKYVQSKKPFADFVLFSSTSESFCSKPTNEIDGFEYISLGKIGTFHNYIYTNSALRQQNHIRYFWSGYTVANQDIVEDYPLPQNFKNKAGVFTYLEITNNIIRIQRDNFGFEHLFVCQNGSSTVISNRLHLLLMMVRNQLGSRVDEKHAMFKLLSARNFIVSQNCGYQTDINNISVVPFYMDVTISKRGFRLIDNEIGLQLSNAGIERFHYAKYFDLFDKSILEINQNTDALMCHAEKNNKFVIFDLSAGMDSRVAYAALTNQEDRHSLSHIRINTHDTQNELSVAMTVNNIYKIPFDDLPQTTYSSDFVLGDHILRSIFLGIYYSYNYFNSRVENPNCIQLYGAYGELSRPYVSLKFLGTSFDDLQTTPDTSHYMMCDYSPSFLTDKDNILPFEQYYSEVLDEQPVNFAAAKILTHYVTRHSYHFSEQLHKIVGSQRFATMNSASMYLANMYSMPIFNSLKLQLDMLGAMNETMLEIPFGDVKYNDELRMLNQYLVTPPREIRALDSDRSSWEEARLEKNRKRVSKTECKLNTSINITEEKQHAVWDSLHAVLECCPEIEKRLGVHLWFYISENIHNTNRMNELYNKLCSITDQMELTGQK